MTPQGAFNVLRRIDAANQYAKSLSKNAHAERARGFAELLPTAPDDWVLDWVVEHLRTGEIPTQMDVINAWAATAVDRTRGVEVPPAPPEVEADPPRWLAWDRARRRALLEGSTPEDAVMSADAAVGVRRRPVPVPDEAEVAAIQARLTKVASAFGRRHVALNDEEMDR